LRARLPWLAAGVAAGAALWLALRAADERGRRPAREEAPARVSAAPAPGGSPVAPTPEPAPLPGSLAGSEPDGGLVRGADGRFVPTRDALDLFDYFLAASGEEPDARIRSRIEAAIAARLDDPAPALELLDRHLAYRAEARELFADEFAATLPLERRLQRIRELRRAHFGDELADALFAAEEEGWRVDVERLRVLHDPALAEHERAARLAALEAELPEPVLEARAAATAALSLRRDEARLRAEGATDAELDALREARFGPEAATRLAALDRARAEWDARVAAYRAERERVAAEEPDDAEARAAALAALRDARFSGAERLRIEALDRLEASRASATPERASSAGD
jgi:lipase chaperone LimK